MAGNILPTLRDFMMGISNSVSFLTLPSLSSKPRKKDVYYPSLSTNQGSVKYSLLSDASKNRAKERLVILSAGLGSV